MFSPFPGAEAENMICTIRTRSQLILDHLLRKRVVLFYCVPLGRPISMHFECMLEILNRKNEQTTTLAVQKPLFTKAHLTPCRRDKVLTFVFTDPTQMLLW